VKAWKFTEWGGEFPVDVPLAQARAEDFDALLLPGGVINPDKLRMLPEAVAFAKAFFDANKPGVDLPRPLDHHRGGCRTWVALDLMAVPPNHPHERRGGLGGSGGRRRSARGHEPQA